MPVSRTSGRKVNAFVLNDKEFEKNNHQKE